MRTTGLHRWIGTSDATGWYLVRRVRRWGILSAGRVGAFIDTGFMLFGSTCYLIIPVGSKSLNTFYTRSDLTPRDVEVLFWSLQPAASCPAVSVLSCVQLSVTPINETTFTCFLVKAIILWKYLIRELHGNIQIFWQNLRAALTLTGSYKFNRL